MKKSLVLAMAMALGVTASAYAANPFSDVPAGHWAYDSIDKLAAAGVIEGMGDGTYQGDKTMTRYEMAQIVAKAMAKGANVDKLAAEFADELDNLGVRVANLEKKADNVKITGQIRYHYKSAKVAGTKSSADVLRSRLTIKGQINDSWTYTALLQNEQKFAHEVKTDEDTVFQRAYVNGRIGGLAIQAGRYAWTDITGGNIYDTRMDGVQASYGKKINVTAFAGKANKAATLSSTKVDDNSKMYGVEASTKFGVVGAHGAWYRFDDAHNMAKLQTATVGVAAPVAKDLNLTADYIRASKEKGVDKDGFVIGANYKGAKAAKVGSWGLFAKYYDQGKNTIVAHTMNGESGLKGGIKGYQVGANYTFAKNIVGEVQYYDLKAKQGSDKAKTLWSQVVLTF